MSKIKEAFKEAIDACGEYYYYFHKLCDAISDEELRKMLIKEKMITNE